jgi:hypothetical protein
MYCKGAARIMTLPKIMFSAHANISMLRTKRFDKPIGSE